MLNDIIQFGNRYFKPEWVLDRLTFMIININELQSSPGFFARRAESRV